MPSKELTSHVALSSSATSTLEHEYYADYDDFALPLFRYPNQAALHIVKKFDMENVFDVMRMHAMATHTNTRTKCSV